MLTAVYARYSSSLQSPSSIEDQIALCRRHTERHGLTVSEEHFYLDREVSGAVSDRPEYQRMMQAAKRHEFDAIICEAQDRMWRDQGEMHSTLRRLRFWGVKVFSVATGVDLTEESGGILATVVGLKDEAFLQDLRRKTHRGMAGKVGRGYSVGGAAYGYKSMPEYDPARKDEYGRPIIVGVRRVIDDSQAKIVLRIFGEYASGLSPKAIVHRLNAERVPPPRPKQGRKAQGWTWTTVRGMLRNRLFIGEVYWNRSGKERDPDGRNRRVTRQRPRSEWLRGPDRPDLRIVSAELWARVEARRAEVTKQSRGRPGGPRPRYLFSGILRCGMCGAHYIIKDKRGYACSFYLNRGPHVCKNGRTAKRDVLERALLADIQEEILSPQAIAYLTAQVNKELARATSRGASARKALEASLREAEREVENIKQAVRLGMATTTLLEMLEEAESRTQRLRAELSAAPKAKANIRAIPGLVEGYVRDLRATLGRDVDRARELLSRLLGEIILRPDRGGLVYEMRGNLGVLVDGQGASAAIGAGRGI